jgi:DNA-directed RNA polymerase specialized sigma24 family protein
MNDSLLEGLAELVRQAQAGSPQAVAELFGRCGEPLRAIIRNAMPAALHKLYDEDEFVNDTILIICRNGFPERVLRSPKKLWSYIMRIAEHGIHAVRKELERACRDIRREEPLREIDPVSHELGPEGTAIANELAEKIRTALIERQRGKGRDIARLWLSERCSGLEIARRLGLNRNAVQRTLASFKKKVQAIISPDK